MKKYFLLFCVLVFIVGYSNGSNAREQDAAKISLGDIIEKNIEAAGGKEKIEPIKAISLDLPDRRFRQFLTRFFATSDGNLKAVSYIDDMVSRVVTVNKGEVKVNSFLSSGMKVDALDKVRMKCFAKLFSGAFALGNFRDDLKFQGTKKYGPKKLYYLSTTLDDHDVEFFIDAETFILKRLVFKGSDQEKGKYEWAYDFGAAEDMNGFKIPASSFQTYVGAGPSRNNNMRLANFKVIPEFKKGFFDEREVNLGSVTAKKNSLKGNLLVSIQTPQGVIYQLTNWSDENLEIAALKSNDKVKITFAGSDYDGIYFEKGEEINDKIVSQGAIVLLKREENFPIIIFFGGKYKAVHENFKKLQEVTVTKIINKEKEG